MCRPKGYGFCTVIGNYGGGGVLTYLPFQFQMNKKETVICEFEMDFKKSVCWRSLRIQI